MRFANSACGGAPVAFCVGGRALLRNTSLPRSCQSHVRDALAGRPATLIIGLQTERGACGTESRPNLRPGRPTRPASPVDPSSGHRRPLAATVSKLVRSGHPSTSLAPIPVADSPRRRRRMHPARARVGALQIFGGMVMPDDFAVGGFHLSALCATKLSTAWTRRPSRTGSVREARGRLKREAQSPKKYLPSRTRPQRARNWMRVGHTRTALRNGARLLEVRSWPGRRRPGRLRTSKCGCAVEDGTHGAGPHRNPTFEANPTSPPTPHNQSTHPPQTTDDMLASCQGCVGCLP